MYSSVKARFTYKHVILFYFNLLLFKLFFILYNAFFLHYQIIHLDSEQKDMLSSTTHNMISMFITYGLKNKAKLAHVHFYIHNFEIRFIDMGCVFY